MSKYSDFYTKTAKTQVTQQMFFGTTKKFDIPEFKKSPGIGNSVGEELGPGCYESDPLISTLRDKWKHDI